MEYPDFDLYEELEVSRRASHETIEAAYRSLVKRFHPDVAIDKRDAELHMKRINIAHDVLSDPSSRKGYDAERERRGTQGEKRSRSQSASSGNGGPSATRGGGDTHAAGPFNCPRCGKGFRTEGGLNWHLVNYTNCAAGK
jgi:DnaJ-class molecular chaperone